MTRLFAGHIFKWKYDKLHWKLFGVKEYRDVDFLSFSDSVITAFTLRGKFLVVLADGRINEIQGFCGKETDYERICMVMRVWL